MGKQPKIKRKESEADEGREVTITNFIRTSDKWKTRLKSKAEGERCLRGKNKRRGIER